MIHLTQTDLQRVAQRADDAEASNVKRVACTMLHFFEWVERHSDGWAYNSKARKAARSALRMLEVWNVPDDVRPDITATQAAQLIAPVADYLALHTTAEERAVILTGDSVPKVRIVAVLEVDPAHLIDTIDALELKFGAALESVQREA